MESVTLTKLLELVGKGETHVSTAAEIARAVEYDSNHEVAKGLHKLAACGNNGNCPSNTERDFRRFVKDSFLLKVEPYIIKLVLEVPHHQVREAFCLF